MFLNSGNFYVSNCIIHYCIDNCISRTFFNSFKNCLLCEIFSAISHYNLDNNCFHRNVPVLIQGHCRDSVLGMEKMHQRFLGDDDSTENSRHLPRMPTCIILLYISSVYNTFSDRVGLPLNNITSSGVLMKSIGAEYLRQYAPPGVNHMRVMQYQIVLNIVFCPELN